jgi:hypothetical protein
MTTSSEDTSITFDGSNWQDLSRLATASRMKFLQTANLEDDPYATDEAKCAYLVSHFRGPALDWAGERYDNNPAAFNQYIVFVQTVRQAFGISDEGLRAQRRGQLEGLKWQSDLAVFFAEFDRLTQQLGLTEDATKIALVRNKLPVHVQKLLAEQALDFANYSTMRERLLVMWNLDPSRSSNIVAGSGSSTTKKRPRCGRCGKKGHAASECRSKN